MKCILKKDGKSVAGIPQEFTGLEEHFEGIAKERKSRMYNTRIVQQVKRKEKAMTGILKKAMILFAVLFVVMGITISQGFMLPGFLVTGLYFIYDVLSQREYEYVLEGSRLEISVIYGGRYRKEAHMLDLKDVEAVAPSRHEKVAAYLKDGGSIRIPKYDYTSYEENVPYYTMIVMEDKQKIKILMDLNEEMLGYMKSKYPDKVFLQ